MSNSKEIIDALIKEDLYTAKKLINEDLVARMGDALEDKLVDFGPTLFGEGVKKDEDEDEEDEDNGKKKKKKFNFFEKKKKTKTNEDVQSEEDIIAENFEAELKSLVEEIEEETGEELSEEEIIDIANMLLDMINEDETGEKAQQEDDADIAKKDAEDKATPAVKLQKSRPFNGRLGNAEY